MTSGLPLVCLVASVTGLAVGGPLARGPPMRTARSPVEAKTLLRSSFAPVASAVDATDGPPPLPSGHVFVIHGDVRSLLADAVLYPTRLVNDTKWFPDGLPAGQGAIDQDAFTPEQRVQRVQHVPGSRQVRRDIWLGHVDGRSAPVEPGSDRASLTWFLDAASHFLMSAHAVLVERASPPLGGRTKHVLAMPVVGTGEGGARGSTGEMIAGLLQLLEEFVASHDADVALVVKNDRMFSAAQAHRRQLDQQWPSKLGARLAAASADLAALAASERLCLFLGAGVSVGAGLPEWEELLRTLASRSEVPLNEAEVCPSFAIT